jgi:hypothetical protein
MIQRRARPLTDSPMDYTAHAKFQKRARKALHTLIKGPRRPFRAQPRLHLLLSTSVSLSTSLSFLQLSLHRKLCVARAHDIAGKQTRWSPRHAERHRRSRRRGPAVQSSSAGVRRPPRTHPSMGRSSSSKQQQQQQQQQQQLQASPDESPPRPPSCCRAPSARARGNRGVPESKAARIGRWSGRADGWPRTRRGCGNAGGCDSGGWVWPPGGLAAASLARASRPLIAPMRLPPALLRTKPCTAALCHGESSLGRTRNLRWWTALHVRLDGRAAQR